MTGSVRMFEAQMISYEPDLYKKVLYLEQWFPTLFVYKITKTNMLE